MFLGRPVQEVMLFLFCIYENRVRADQCHHLSAVFPACSQEGDHPHTPVNHSFLFPVSQELAMITGFSLLLKREPLSLCLGSSCFYSCLGSHSLYCGLFSLKQDFYVKKLWRRVVEQNVSHGTLQRTRSLQSIPGWVVTSPLYASSVKWDQRFPEQCRYSGDSMGPAFRLTSVQVLE